MKKALSYIVLSLYTIYLSVSNFGFSRNANIDKLFGVGQSGFNGIITSIDIQEDGKIIVAGTFSSYNGQAVSRLARINIDGTLDSSFDAGSNTSATINATAIGSDGSILVGGSFRAFANTSAGNFVKLNPDGSFQSSPSGTDGAINDFKILNDGKIVLVGGFRSYNNQTARRIVKLNSDLSIDTTFVSGNGFNNIANTIAEQSDGKLIVGGTFTNYNGQTINRLVRINTNGSRDTSFNIGAGFNNTVRAVAIQEDGKILVGGKFTNHNSQATNRFSRVNSDGSKDTSFNIGNGFNGTVMSIAIQKDGKILVGGAFTSYNGQTANRIIRLNSDGTIDNSFNMGNGINGVVNKIKLKTDGAIIVGGEFTNYNGNSVNNIVSLVGTSPVYLPTTNNTTEVINEFTRKGYELINSSIFGEVLSGDNQISFKKSNGVIPVKIDILNEVGLLSLSANTTLTNRETSNIYTGTIHPAQKYQGFNVINNEPVLSMISVGSDDHNISLSPSANISLLVSNITENDFISTYSSSDGIQRNYEKKGDISIQNGATIASFDTNHFSYFATTQSEGIGESSGNNQASFRINNGSRLTQNQNVTLNILGDGISQMRFRNEDGARSNRENFKNTKNRTLSSGFGGKTVYAQLDINRNITTLQASITYNEGSGSGSGDIDVSLTITGGVTECIYSTNIDLGTQGGNLDDQQYIFSGTFSPSTRYCADYTGLSGWAFSIQASDLQNAKGDIISGSNIFISNSEPIIKGNSACKGYDGSRINFYDTPLVLMEKTINGNNDACKVEIPNVSLEVEVPAYQAPGKYSGTITITMPNGF